MSKVLSHRSSYLTLGLLVFIGAVIFFAPSLVWAQAIESKLNALVSTVIQWFGAAFAGFGLILLSWKFFIQHDQHVMQYVVYTFIGIGIFFLSKVMGPALARILG